MLCSKDTVLLEVETRSG